MYATELTIEEWQRALASLRDFIGRYVIQFAGGEPFLKQGFVELLAHCRREGIDWGVITNGSAFRSEAVVAKVVAARPMNIDVSVDAADVATHDFVRGVPGSLRAIEARLVRLRDERARSGRHFPIRITPTVSRLNVRARRELRAPPASMEARNRTHVARCRASRTGRKCGPRPLNWNRRACRSR